MSETTVDPPLTDEQENLVSNLSEADIQNIDKALLSNISAQWRKVARIVGTTMTEHKNRITGIPDVFYAQRVSHLVETGIIESQGNLKAMRFCEIRIPK
jgi:hypothetical protein